MESNRTYLGILIESLEKKAEVLDQIIAKNEEQKLMLNDDNMDEDDFTDNLKAKEELIEQLELLDDGFQEVYNRIKEELVSKKDAYADEIKRMQELISEITDKSMTIRAGEERNRQAAQRKFSLIRGEIHQAQRSRNAATKYYSSMSRVNYVDAQFMDKRK